MLIEAVTVSIGHGDFLRHTAKENQHLLDHMVVVTTEDDDETIEVCRRHSIHYVMSDDWTRGGDFNKARLIQRGFDQISAKDWVLHLDADIVLPRQFRRMLEIAHLDERCIYGADRCNLVGYEAWKTLKRDKGCWDNHSYQNYLRVEEGDGAGSRWASTLHGYCPVGFFQLFHGSQMIQKGHHVRTYPYHHGDAARSDVQFALQWDRRFRCLLPEVVVLHLESEAAQMGANWRGRRTRRFGPEVLTPKHGGAVS